MLMHRQALQCNHRNHRPPFRNPHSSRKIGHQTRASGASQENTDKKKLVKICGITSEEDAQFAAKSGANFIGMIMWPKAKRSVSIPVARQIVAAAQANGAEPVGVFVDEDAATILARCSEAGLRIAQLHGEQARASLEGLQNTGLKTIYVMHATAEGTLQTTPPALPVDWILIDGMQGGSGQAINWSKLESPKSLSTHGWLLAGGLTPDNVAQALQIVDPQGVDVSSGVCGPDGLRKDHQRISAFITGAQSVQ